MANSIAGRSGLQSCKAGRAEPGPKKCENTSPWVETCDTPIDLEAATGSHDPGRDRATEALGRNRGRGRRLFGDDHPPDHPRERCPPGLPRREPRGGGEVRGKLDASSVLRGGEQDAARIDGYDHGPFPDEYPPETVVGRDVVFVTTNGTRAIADAAPAERVLLGCLRNAPAIARYLQGSGADSVYLICAGSAGRFTVEDFLGAATVLACMDTGGWLLNDGAWMALDFMDRYRGRELEALKESRAGRWFFEHDRMDAFEFVGEIGASELVPLVRAGQLVSTPPPAAYQHLSRG